MVAEQYFPRHATYRTQLWWKEQGQYCWTCFHELRVDFTIAEPSWVSWSGNVNFVHRRLQGIGGVIGWGFKGTLRYDPLAHANMPTPPASGANLAYWQSAQPNVLFGSKIADNIVSIEQHYGGKPIPYFKKQLIEPGAYRMEWWGNAHSSNWPDGTNGLLECNQNLLPDGTVDLVSANSDPYTYLFVKVEV